MNRILLSIFVMSYLSSSAQQWKNYTIGLNINCITIDKDTAWIGSDGGVAKYLTDGTLLATYTRADGLASDNVTSIAIDSQGVKWFATGDLSGIANYLSNGVTKFDGTNWTTYNVYNSGLVDSNIYNITIDKQNNKWCVATGRFYKYDGASWTQYTSADSALVHGFCPMTDSHGNVWYWLTEFDGHVLTHYQIPTNLSSNFGCVDGFAMDSHDNLWVSGSTCGYPPQEPGGLLKFDGVNWYDYTDSIGGATNVYQIVVDKSDNLWFANGDCVSSYGSGGFVTYCNSPADSNSLGTGVVERIALDSQNHVWVGTRVNYGGQPTTGGGVSRFNGSNWLHLYPANCPLSSNFVAAIASDHHNDTWVSSTNLLKFDSRNWTAYSNSDYTNSLAYESGSCTYVDDQDNKWFYGGVLTKYDGTNWSTFADQWGDVIDANYFAIDKRGIIWCGTYYGNLMSFDGANWFSYNQNNSPLIRGGVWSIAVDAHNTKWFVTDTGIVKYDGTNWTLLNAANNGLTDTLTTIMTADKQGNIWIGTQTCGLAKYDGTNWTNYSNPNSGLAGVAISSIAIDKGNNKWLATYSNFSYTGVTKFDGSNWTIYNKHNSRIAEDFITGVSSDLEGNVWFMTAQSGISELLSNTDTAFAIWLQFNESICGDDTITLNPLVNGGTPPFAFSWQAVGDSLSCYACQHPAAAITQPSTFIVQITDSNNQTVSDTLLVQPCIPAGIARISGDDPHLSVYPNPFDNTISVTLQTENAKEASVTVLNTMGQAVFVDQENNLNGTFTITFDLNALSDGVYFLQVTTDAARAIRKIVKQ